MTNTVTGPFRTWVDGLLADGHLQPAEPTALTQGCDDPDNVIHPEGCRCADARWDAQNYSDDNWCDFGRTIREALDSNGVTDPAIRRELREDLQDSWRTLRAEERWARQGYPGI